MRVLSGVDAAVAVGFRGIRAATVRATDLTVRREGLAI
jgi:hypothetical protein